MDSSNPCTNEVFGMTSRLFMRLIPFHDGSSWNTLHMINTDLPSPNFYWTRAFHPRELLAENLVEDFDLDDMMILVENGWWEEVPF